jgi:hypothetical protein
MTIEEQRRLDAEKASAALPDIVSELRSGDELIGIGRRIAERHDIEETKAFKWVQIVSESFERQRRRIAILGSALLWLGAAATIVGIVLSLLGVAVPSIVPGLLPGYVVLIVLGLVLVAGGLWLGLRAPRLVVVTEDTLTG